MVYDDYDGLILPKSAIFQLVLRPKIKQYPDILPKKDVFQIISQQISQELQ